MPSPFCEKAITEALHYGNALLKFISPNDTGMTGSHQSGPYMPFSAWKMYTPHPPTKGENKKHDVLVEWQDGTVTKSVVTWYGKGTRSEYRLTRFGRDFPWFVEDSVGDLLVLIPVSLTKFRGYVFDEDGDVEEILAALGIQPFDHWAIFQKGAPSSDNPDACLDRAFAKIAGELTDFPSGRSFSEYTRDTIGVCDSTFATHGPDKQLLSLVETEYRLFRMVERQLCSRDVTRLFKDVDDFLKTAASIMNRRKSRAGRSLENHVDHILTQANIPHEMQPKIDGKPDVVIPSTAAYYDSKYPRNKVCVLGVKTTCKDRWRQVLSEGKRVQQKSILTVQQGISTPQLKQMKDQKVSLIVPKQLHKRYRPPQGMKFMTVEEFIDKTRRQLK